MTVTYPDSSWFTEFLGVGDDSFGTLMVQGAATVTSSEVHIGGFANGNGDATVDDFGTWTVSGPFDVAWGDSERWQYRTGGASKCVTSTSG